MTSELGYPEAWLDVYVILLRFLSKRASEPSPDVSPQSSTQPEPDHFSLVQPATDA